MTEPFVPDFTFPVSAVCGFGAERVLCLDDAVFPFAAVFIAGTFQRVSNPTGRKNGALPVGERNLSLLSGEGAAKPGSGP